MISRPWLIPALALWGWQTDVLPAALVMGALLEAPRLLSARIDIRSEDFNRLWSFTGVMFVAVVFYLILGRQGLTGMQALVSDPTNDGMRRASDTALTFLHWLPFVLFPFTLAHAWSRTPTLPWRTFSLYAQAQAKRHSQLELPAWIDRPMHPGMLFLTATLFSSASSAAHPTTYLPLLVGVLLLALWPGRSRRYGVVAWSVLTLALMGAALVAQHGHQVARQALQTVEDRLFNRSGGGGGSNAELLKRSTALGMVGELKLSSQIILRIERDGDGPAPGLLREAAFTRCSGTVWSTSDASFTALPPDRLATASVPGSLRISRFTRSGDIPLPLPSGPGRLYLLTPGTVAVNSLGAVRLQEGPDLVRYEATPAAPGDTTDSDAPPGPDDLDLSHVNPVDQTVLLAIAKELGLPGRTASNAIARVEGWFGDGHFSYRRWQDQTPIGSTPLTQFLRATHAGHCEYFASATTLLLRAAGVPTRYAVGYVPMPAGDHAWRARGRDIHAWCLAYDGQRWRTVDTTPSIWLSADANGAEWYEPLTDVLSDLWFQLTNWRQNLTAWTGVIFIGGCLVLAWIAWRQIRGSRWRRVLAHGRSGASARDPLDLAMHAWLAALAARHPNHRPRQPHETPAAWIARLALPPDPVRDEALALHQRLRYAPGGLNDTGRRRLAAELTHLRANVAS